MWSTIISVVLNNLSTLLPLILGAITLIGGFFKAKYDGAKEERAKIEVQHYKEVANAERQRSETESAVDALSDDELERLRDKWTSG